MKLNYHIEAFLTSNARRFTYGELAKMFHTSARGIGSCMRSIARRNPSITELVVFSK